MTKPRFTLYQQTTGSYAGIEGPFVDPSVLATVYDDIHIITSGTISQPIDLASYRYFVLIQGESGTGSIAVPNLKFYALTSTVTVNKVDEG